MIGDRGIIFKSPSYFGPWEPRSHSLFDYKDFRNCGLLVRGDELFVAWSKIGDVPEQILLSRVNISCPDWDEW